MLNRKIELSNRSVIAIQIVGSAIIILLVAYALTNGQINRLSTLGF